MEITTQKLKLAAWNVRYRFAETFGSVTSRQRILEALVILRTSVSVSEKFAAQDDLFYNLLNRTH